MSSKLSPQSAMLDEVKRELNEQFGSIGVSKDTARSMLTASSLIIAVIGLVSGQFPPPDSNTWDSGIVVALWLFIVLVLVAMITLSPAEVSTPIEMTRENIESYYDITDDELRDELIDRYLEKIKANGPVVKFRIALSKVSGLLLTLIVISLVAPYLG